MTPPAMVLTPTNVGFASTDIIKTLEAVFFVMMKIDNIVTVQMLTIVYNVYMDITLPTTDPVFLVVPMLTANTV